MTQKRNTAQITKGLFTKAGGAAGTGTGGASGGAAGTEAGDPIPGDVLETLVVATIALKYTQSNSVCIAHDGQVIGMGAGQQSRVHCTRLACGKADKWLLQQHPKTMALAIKAGLPKPEKANLVDYFLLWDELSEVEKGKLRAAPRTPRPPLRRSRTAAGRRSRRSPPTRRRPTGSPSASARGSQTTRARARSGGRARRTTPG